MFLFMQQKVIGFLNENGIMSESRQHLQGKDKYTKEQAIATFVGIYDKII